jgi:protein-tyrosine phosphatase
MPATPNTATNGAATPSRSLRLTGAPNFRDLGGYRGLDGRSLRWRRLLRSDHLGALTTADFTVLHDTLGPDLRVCDFRGVNERASAACAIPGATVHSLPIEPTVVQRITDLLAAGRTLSAADMVGLMQETYRGFVRENTARFAMLFTHLLGPQQSPLVFHCTAGKDRTGFAAALILLSLGVAREQVLHDYLLTNDHLPADGAARGALPAEAVAVLYRVQEDFLAAALDAVEQDFGSIEHYFSSGLGLARAERAELARRYLAP